LKQRVAAVGLGVGAAASYAEPGQQWTFYEIDPEVERIAANPKYFTHLQDCRGDVKVVLGMPDCRCKENKMGSSD